MVRAEQILMNINCYKRKGNMETKDDIKYSKIIEGILFISAEPVELKKISSFLQLPVEVIKKYLFKLKEEYDKDIHGIVLKEYDGKYVFVTKSDISQFIEDFFNVKNQQKLSSAALETLAIIAYKQPVTRVEIEEIRGVKAEKTLSTLIKYELIHELGRKETTGTPIVYGTTNKFLRHFNLKSLSELPDFNIEGQEFNCNYQI
jgi:segregation and condensation protein B